MRLLPDMLNYSDSGEWVEAPIVDLPPLTDIETERIKLYRASRREPYFSPGYEIYKLRLALEVAASKKFRTAFANGELLPEPFGSRLDERIVEYPWVFSRMPIAQSESNGLMIDAGSTFNKRMLLGSPFLTDQRLVIYTLETDFIAYNPMVSYIFGDLRDMLIKAETADAIICISTLEHVGFTYDYKNYSRHKPWPREEPHSYIDALREFRRVLKPEGKLLLTLPFGKFENHGWLQQFDAAMIEQVKDAFDGKVGSEYYYRYNNGGWQVTEPGRCSQLSYFNIHETGEFEEDGLAAARAICCLELIKPAL